MRITNHNKNIKEALKNKNDLSYSQIQTQNESFACWRYNPKLLVREGFSAENVNEKYPYFMASPK